MRNMLLPLFVAATLVSMTSVTVSQAACTACRCGDHLFLTSADRLGSGLTTGKFRLSLQQQYIQKSSAFIDHSAHAHGRAAQSLSAAVADGESSLTEHRVALRLAYSLSRAILFTGELPYSAKRFESLNGGIRQWERSTGPGDLELSVIYSPMLARLRWSRWSGQVSLLAKLPTGEDRATKGSDILTHQVQPGTGSLDWQWGGALLYARETWGGYASLYYRLNGTNDIDYRMGSALLFNLGLQRQLTKRLALSLQANGRIAERDNHNGFDVEHTGGTVLFAAPGGSYRLASSLSLYATVMIPALEELNDVQDEKVSFTGGLGVGF